MPDLDHTPLHSISIEIERNGPATARYHREAIEQIVQCVEEGVYCALLGPRLSGKTILLRYIEDNLARLLGWTCVYVNLLDIRATTQQVFFAELIRAVSNSLTEQKVVGPLEAVVGFPSSAGFRAFLSDLLTLIRRNLVLIIDPLEALPTDLVQALLTSLRAAYMDQQGRDHQLTVVVSGALSLATVTVGESSPFRGIVRRVFIGDLSEKDSRSLIHDMMAEAGVSATNQALKKLLEATRGDIFLIRRICERCAETIATRKDTCLQSRHVTRVVERFLKHEVFQYAPLIEAIRLIEEDPDLLHCILRLLEKEQIARTELPLPLSPDLDPLYLTGVVEKIDGENYRLQNLIYRRFLARHFTPGRVGHLLTMAGRWDAALDYLEAGLRQAKERKAAGIESGAGKKRFSEPVPGRVDLLPATINSIYASQDLAQAVHFLRRGLAAAFDVADARVWMRSAAEGNHTPEQLTLIAPAEVAAEADLHIDINADRLEARAYRYQMPLRGQEGEQRIIRAIPLMIPGSRPIGVVTISDELPEESATGQRERELQLVGFLNQAARALQTVSLRRQELTLAGRVQSNLLPPAPPSLPGWQMTAIWRPARETSGDFYDFIPLPGGRLGLVLADVVDKGMAAALLMTLTRTLIRTYAPEYTYSPERLLEIVNQRILEDINTGQFVTMFYGVLDPFHGWLSYSIAGHPPPYLFPRNEDPFPLIGHGLPLGVDENGRWDPAQVEIPPHALLVLYTDGLLEAQNRHGEYFGVDHMLEAISPHLHASAKEVQDVLINRINTFAGAGPQIDDIALMVIARGEKVEEEITRKAIGSTWYYRRMRTGSVE